jgi:tetratricopeptide (TPR) repeat protein
MGVVYKARQVSLDRLVALKMILLAEYAGPRERARFQAEAEAVARLAHPHVVQIHEVGEHAGRPFFSLEFVPGGSLADRLAGTPLPARQAAALAQALARTMHAAHQRGIVHRDLKPANVLLAEDGTPKVTDFGLAKRLDAQAGATQSGAIVGTPSYMAPEQAGGKNREVGPAADVYALGAILYEMLTGRPPFKAQTPLDTLLQVLGDEPVPPCRLQPRTPRDLETICLRCLRKEPARRYASAGDLADDLGRFLEGRPVAARPAPRWERVLKWTRRRPAVAALAAAVLVVTAVGLGLVAWKWREAERQRDRARARFQMARAAVDAFYVQLSENPDLRARGLEPLRRRLLESAVGYFQTFAREEADDPEVRAEQGRALLRLGDLHRLLGQNGQAEEALGRARDLFQGLADAHPHELAYQQDLARSLRSQGALYQLTGRLGQAEEALGQAHGLCHRLAQAHPDQPRCQEDLAETLLNLGSVRYKAGRLGLVEEGDRQARDLFGHLAQDHPEEPRYRRNLAHASFNLGVLYANTDRLGQAEQAYQDALKLRRRLAADDPDEAQHQEDLAVVLQNLGALYLDLNRPDRAGPVLREALALKRRLAEAHPLVPGYRKSVADTLTDLANLESDTNHPDRACATIQEAVAIQERLVEANPEVVEYAADLAASYFNLGNYLTAAGKRAEAVQWYGRAVSRLEENLKRDPADADSRKILLKAHGWRAVLLARLGRGAEAEADLREAAALFPDPPPRDVHVFRALARGYAGDHAAAAAAADAAAAGPDVSGLTWYNLATAYSLAAAAAGKDGRLPAADREKLAGDYAARAVALLRRAREAGYFQNAANVEPLVSDADYAPLRPRQDFRELLAALRAAGDGRDP